MSPPPPAPAALGLYRGATRLLGPVIDLYVRRRLARGKEDPARIGERLGHPGQARPAGTLVWVHAASVGEALSVAPLIERLLERLDEGHVLLTTGTVTSAQLAAERLPARALHQFVPIDRPAAVRRFLDHWRPDLALWVESELWPNLIAETQMRGVAMALINGRLSARSTARWRRAGGLARHLLGGFTLCLAQSAEDAARFTALGARAVHCAGNLKDAAPPLPTDSAALAALTAELADRPRWLAASTHAGEETLVGTAHRAVRTRHPTLLTLLVPRHPERGGAIAEALARQGLQVTRRSAGAPITAATDIYVADTLGELGLFYRLAGIAFVGGSLVAHGGQNPLEPARLDCAVLHGPHMTNFAPAVAALAEAGGAVAVADATALSAALGRLLDDPVARARCADAAGRVAAAGGDVLDRVMAHLAPLLAVAAAPQHVTSRANA